MTGKKKIKMSIFLCSFVIVLTTIIFLVYTKRQLCMGIPIIAEKSLLKYNETTDLELSCLMFEGEKMAVDWPSYQFYISQSEKNLKNYYNLKGRIESAHSEYELFFLDTEPLRRIKDSVREGKTLTLIVKCGINYQKVDVVITTLPVVYLDVENIGKDSEDREIVKGKMVLWNDSQFSSEQYLTKTSNAEWRMRGNSTRTLSKLAWKLNLRDSDGKNNKTELLGLGSDDDWILNPMSMDDTFVKEKIMQELWKQLVSGSQHNYKMSQGEYVELFINGAYQGIYLLQRRVDTKYLELDKDVDILMKGINTWEAESSREAYEVVSSPYEEEYSYDMLDDAMAFKQGNGININNFIDVSLMLQFISGTDNFGYKNTFYVLQSSNGTFELSLVPWDTDLSFGVTWGYDYEDSLDEIIERYELKSVRENVENIDLMFAKRWIELRNTILSENNILKIYQELIEELDMSGAVTRDEEKWGLHHDGEDTRENLSRFIKERLRFLDDYYNQFLNHKSSTE